MTVDSDLLKAVAATIATLQEKGLTNEANVIIWAQRDMTTMMVEADTYKEKISAITDVVKNPQKYPRPLTTVSTILEGK